MTRYPLHWWIRNLVDVRRVTRLSICRNNISTVKKRGASAAQFWDELRINPVLPVAWFRETLLLLKEL